MSNPLCENAAKTERLDMTDGQLELGFGGGAMAVRLTRRERHISRAGWWFAQMRQLADRAMDWEPAPAGAGPRPEQVWFPVAQRRVQV